jgi:peptidoglycan/xylan/chitin deacetylase (PgdA/CDA1 family)
VRPDESLGPTFLLYHDVLAVAGGEVRVARTRFERHVATIADAGFRFVPMASFLGTLPAEDGAPTAASPLTSRDVVVTIDDGSRSFFDVAWPVLKDHGVTPTLFVLAGFMGLSGDVDFMTWDDLDMLAEAGVDIGSHGTAHVPLDQIDPARAQDDVLGGAAALRERGFSPHTFAYPFGRYNAPTKQLVRDAGFEAAFSVMGGGWDRYEIRRRLFSGLENPATTRLVMSRAFFPVREALRAVVPKRFLRQEQPVADERWGPEAFGVEA